MTEEIIIKYISEFGIGLGFGMLIIILIAYLESKEECKKSQTICELKQENAELKELKKGVVYQAYMKANERLYDKTNRYEKALEEIREMCEFMYDEVDKENDGYYEIMNKINEVLKW